MKVSTTKITVEIDLDEWKEIYSQWEEIIYSTNSNKVEVSDNKKLHAFITNIQLVANNPSHTINRKII